MSEQQDKNWVTTAQPSAEAESDIPNPVIASAPVDVVNDVKAATTANTINFGIRAETELAAKVKNHNQTAPRNRRASLATLKAVYRRGAASYSASHPTGVLRGSWAMERVDAFLKLLKSGKPANSAYKSDNDLLPISHPQSAKKSSSLVASALVPEERDFADAILQIVATHGKFDDDNSGVWVGYTSAARNDKKDKGIYCEHCVFYAGGTECMIIAQPVEPEGMCRLAAIPDGVVDSHMRKNEADLASYVAERELFSSLSETNQYDKPGDAILALTEHMGLGYEAEFAIKAVWMRAINDGTDPYARAYELAVKTYDSKDADLLPAREESVEL